MSKNNSNWLTQGVRSEGVVTYSSHIEYQYHPEHSTFEASFSFLYFFENFEALRNATR